MRRDLVLIAEMIAAAQNAIEVLGTLDGDGLAQDRLRRDALLWNMTVLGEAASQVSDEFESSHPGIPWRSPAQLRNRIVHGYWDVDLDIIAVTVRNQLPDLLKLLKAIGDHPPA